MRNQKWTYRSFIEASFYNLLCAVMLFAFINSMSSCSNKHTNTHKSTSDTTSLKVSHNQEGIWGTCSFSYEGFSCEIDSCNCGTVTSTSDTTYISLDPASGGEIQGRVIRVKNLSYDSTSFLLVKHQNRYYISSMGPDPVLDDWILYDSGIDTIRYDKHLNGFYIDTISQVDKERFPKFDTLDFYKAYQKAVGDNMASDCVPENAKAALQREYKDHKQHVREILEQSGVELHRIFVIVKSHNPVQKVIVFTYWHFG